MRRLLVICLLAVSSFGQNSPQWRSAADVAEGARGSISGTVMDIDEGAGRMQITTDEDRFSRITVLADSVTTQYNGFGGVINGQPEIFIGTKGFSNVRLGDRVDVRGIGRGNHAIGADVVTLLGRAVSASQTGVGETRSPNTISTPTNAPPSSSDVTVYGRVEGVVRQVNADEGRVTIETDRREMINIRATRNTPVYYRGQTYQISNLEMGDRVRVEPQSTTTSGGEVSARSMEVIRSVQEGGATPRSVTQLNGRVTRVDGASSTATIDTGRGSVRIDLTNAYDESGARVRSRDLQVGDRVTVTGSFGSNTDLFLATTIRFADSNSSGGPAPLPAPPSPSTLSVVSVWGTVAESLRNGPLLIVRESRTNTEYRLHATDDFAVKTKAGNFTTADHLKEGDSVTVKAYRDADGNYIAQTIRIR